MYIYMHNDLKILGLLASSERANRLVVDDDNLGAFEGISMPVGRSLLLVIAFRG